MKPLPAAEDNIDVFAGKRWIVAAAFLLGLYTLGLDGRWHVGRDSAFYLGLGRSIAAGEGMAFNGCQHAGANPAVPLMWAGVLHFLGENYLIARAIMAAMAILTVVAGCGLARDLRGKGLAAMAMILLAANGKLFGTGQLIQTDLPMACMMTVALLCVRRFLGGSQWAAALAGVALGLMVLSRLVGLVVLPLVLLGVVLDGSIERDWRRRLLGAVTIALMAMPFVLGWFMYYQSMNGSGRGVNYLPGAEAHYALGNLKEIAALVAGNFAHELPRHVMSLLIEQRPLAAVSIPLCLVLVLPGLVRSFARKEAFLLVPVLGYVAFLLTWATTSIDSRYLLPVLAALALWVADSLSIVVHWLGRLGPALARRVPQAAALLAVVCVLAGASLAPGLYKMLRWKFAPTVWQVESPEQDRLCGMAQWVAANTAPQDRLLVREASIVHFWTGRLTVFPLPDSEDGMGPQGQRLEDLAAVADWIVVLPTNPQREGSVWEYVQQAGDAFQRVADVQGYQIYRRIQRPQPAASEPASGEAS